MTLADRLIALSDLEPPENFGALPPIPHGWTVRLTESGGGHFYVCDPSGEERSCIHWNRYVVRRWAINLAQEGALASSLPGERESGDGGGR